MHPYLSLREITLQLELARRLPRRLAYYHLALPIAQDEDVVTIAMAYPDHQAVVRVLETVMGMTVAPVRARAEEIKHLLDQAWQAEIEGATSGILYWSDNEVRRQAVRNYAIDIAPALSLKCIEETVPSNTLQALLQRAQEVRPTLIVAAVQDTQTLSELLNRAALSLLLLQGEAHPPRRILHILRGHTPDRRVLDWIIPIAHTYSAPITLLTAATPTAVNYKLGNPLSNNFVDLLAGDYAVPIAEYGRILRSVNLEGRIRIRQGTLESVIIDELSGGCDFDLVAIATEANGNFVYNVLQQVKSIQSAFLVIKP